MEILWCGDPLTGKTTGAVTFPKPMMYLDFDDTFESVLSVKDKSGKRLISDADVKQITVVKFQRKSFTKLNLRTVQTGNVTPPHTLEAPAIIDRLNSILDDLMHKKGFEGNGVQYQSLVIDSGTKMFQFWKEALVQNMKQPALQKQDYGTLETVLFGQFLPDFKALPIPYKILITHLGMDKDEKLGMIFEFPIATSKPQGRLLAKEFTEFWKQEAFGDRRVIRTVRVGMLQFGTRTGVPDMTDANWGVLRQYIEPVVQRVQEIIGASI